MIKSAGFVAGVVVDFAVVSVTEYVVAVANELWYNEIVVVAVVAAVVEAAAVVVVEAAAVVVAVVVEGSDGSTGVVVEFAGSDSVVGP